MTVLSVQNIGLSSTSSKDQSKIKERSIQEISSSAWNEGGFGICKSVAVAMLIAGFAATSFAMKWPIAAFCTAATVWCIFTAVVIGVHRVTEGTLIGRPIRQLYAVMTEANANFMATLLFPLTLIKSYHNAKGNLHGRPILMVNGFLSFASTWHYQRSRLAQENVGPIYTINMGSGKSIKTYAEHLRDRVKQIQEETGRKDIILIGHSKGGLVCSDFATRLAKDIDAHVTDVITIGSPFKGTAFACFAAASYDGAEMTPGSAFQRELQARMNNCKDVRFAYIASELDGTVPVDSALPDKDEKRQFLIKDLGHAGLLFSSRVADQVCAWVKESLTVKN